MVVPAPPVPAADVVESLRGKDLTEPDKAPVFAKQLLEEGGIARNFEKQPPLIPHTVDKYRITLRENGCLKCHSAANYEKEQAPKVGDSHFIDRDGKQLDKISMGRYFCEQCHVPQVDAPPLVENTFQPVAATP
jgi:cytochrome c-type protein NapB